MSGKTVFNRVCRNLTTGDVFRSQSFDWWQSPHMYPLRAMNQLRVPLITNKLSGKMMVNDKPLSGFNLIDVGCGGGLLSEPLARLGANVVGLDSSTESILAAENHLIQYSPALRERLQYHNKSIEEFVETSHQSFDAIVASEVVEHIHDLNSFFKNCAKILKPNGLLIVTTINQTLTAYILDILLAEKILNIIPNGTHQYDLFVSPTSLSLLLEERE